MQYRILIKCVHGLAGCYRLQAEALRRMHIIHYFVLFLSAGAVTFLLLLFFQLLFKMALAVTMHFGLVAVFAQHAGNIAEVHLILQHNKPLAEVLQQQAY